MTEGGQDVRPGQTRPRVPSPSARGARPTGPEALAELEELRRLLLEEERRRLDRLESVELDADGVAELLPDAILRREARDDRVSRALESTIADGLFKSARKSPQTLADAIHPALGPAIRSMIQASLRQSLERFNVALENSLSPQGLRWRLQAARTGRSFSEVVLLNTLLYRVEQVLLVHRETGLLVEEVRGLEAPDRDADLVAGMLSAIRDFGADSMGTDSGEGPSEIEFEGLSLIVAQGPSAYLTLVVRGTPPRELHARAREAAEALHVEYADELSAFDGDATLLAGTVPLLEDLMESEERPREPNRALRLVPALLGVGLVALLLLLGWRANRAASDLGRVEDALRAAPGVIVTEASIEGGAVRVRGLQDPLARRAGELASLAVAGRGRRVVLEMRPYVSLEPALVLARVRRTFPIPATAALRLEGSTLVAEGIDGAGPLARRLREGAPLMGGIDGVVLTP